jgi:hypothetical protein
MATVSEMRICKVCNMVMEEGVCPEGHRQPGAPEQDTWPSWLERPKTLHSQIKAWAAKTKVGSNIGDDQKYAAEKGRRLLDMGDAFALVSDEEATNMLLDYGRIVTGLLQHRRKPEFVKSAITHAKKIGKAAEATEEYIKATGNTFAFKSEEEV